MTMTMAMPSSEAASSPSKRGLRGPRPQPLKVSSSSRGSSPTSRPNNSKKAGAAAPVIVYEHTPKVVHARPQEFMTVVQRLTGKPRAPANGPTTSSMPYAPNFSPAVEESGDPLLLTLGQRQAGPVLTSPMAAGLLMSPGFIFSPNTMQSIQELSPLF
ncbi:VQ motif-containing protein 8, chloroplastic-like [Phragmites australis]|uniref:VQ motif-containing protein 8, chloroplastic-like n=1 Tax=Phragmites australis TaxID=29695 RepID=UPI002D7747C2|nr:VQ motif-containing protein 8, chloroplastic-like [Phragmites australis]